MIRQIALVCWSLMAASADAELLQQPGLRSIPVGDIERVYYSGPGTLNIVQDATPGLRLQAADEVLDTIVVEFYGDALFIDVPPAAAGKLAVVLSLRSLREIVSDGANQIVGTHLYFDSLSLEARGSGSFNFSALQANELLVTGTSGAAFTLSGSVNRQVLDLADHDLYQAGNLQSRSVEATVIGSGYILLAVDELLDVRLAGAASVRYLGTPYVSQSVSGPGSVKPATARSI